MFTEERAKKYTVLTTPPLIGYTAADTEAALHLLSLAQVLPPAAPVEYIAAPYTEEQAPSLLESDPVYFSFSSQPNSTYVVTGDQANQVTRAVQTDDDFSTESADETLSLDVCSSQSPTSRKPARYDCLVCGKFYATASNLARHKQTHRSLDSRDAKRCNVCNKLYVSMPAFAMHVLTHSMNHACTVCGKHFSRLWLLRGHLRSHTGEKPYQCSMCKKAFGDRSNLRAHEQTHSTDRKHECDRCHKSFVLKTYLNKHLETNCVRASDS